MKLYNVQMSPHCRKVRICAHELGLPLEIVPVNPRSGENRTPDYLQKNPMGKVPTLVDGDFALWESGAILAYLAAKKPEKGLLPTEPRAHADVLRWMFWQANHLDSYMFILTLERFYKPAMMGVPGDEPHMVEYAEKGLARFLPVLEEQLKAHEFVTGRFTIADIALGCGLEGYERAKLDLAPFPNMRGWISRLQARESWKAQAG